MNKSSLNFAKGATAALLAGFLFLAPSCKKDDRTAGICYCKYVNGEKKEYDLRHLPRQSQVDTCNQTNINAGFFGGTCELK